MNLFAHFQGLVLDELTALAASGALPAGLDMSRVTAEPPRDPTHGDIAVNAAMVLAKPAGLNPRALADLLAARLRLHDDIAAAEIAGPGFINLRLKASFWPKLMRSALTLGEAYGRSTMGQGLKVNVEYVSANPTGPLHLGHCRGAVFGDALATLLAESGHLVTKEYYINDAGTQIETLARSAFLRYREALGETIVEIPPGLYPGDYLKPVGAALAAEYGSALLAVPEDKWLPIVRDKAVAMMMDLVREDLASLNIRHDVFFSEKSLHDSGAIAETVQALRSAGQVYEGRLPPPKGGEVPEGWEDREQVLFRASEFGDDIDRPIQKSDGTFTYFAADIAYSRSKISRGFDELVYVLGADHGGYVKRLEAVAAALSGKRVKVVVRLCQLVKLFRAGEPVRMSKRSGDFISLREVVDEVGADVVRFIMLYRKNEAPLDFDFKKVTEQSKDNPVFYVQYAHARICSVFRNAGPAAKNLPEADFSQLSDSSELAVIRRISEYPRQVEAAAAAHEPHRIAFYLYDLASDFHALWNKGKESPQLRFIVGEDAEMTHARLALLAGIRYCLANGLRILGVTPVEAM
ncbi:arginine--tRNA ligase [soil metagenome]